MHCVFELSWPVFISPMHQHVISVLGLKWVLTGARRPLARLCDMYLAGRVHVSQEPSGQNRDRIFQVVDVRDVHVSIDIVCKRLVANTRKTIENGLERRTGGEVEREVNRVKKRERGTFIHWAVRNENADHEPLIVDD